MKTLIKGALVINEGQSQHLDVLIKDDRIQKIAPSITEAADKEINADGLWLIPGLIDDQVHFREPGLTHKGNIATESKAAAAGGITSFMEMPNTNPPATDLATLEEKYAIAQKTSMVNYSFFLGATNNNLDTLLKADGTTVPGVKIFMGSSTGNMLVDNQKALEEIFSQLPLLIATHCEDEDTVRKNTELFKEKYGNAAPISVHPQIRSEEACYLSSSFAVDLAKKHNTRLHILHISTAKETALFSDSTDLENKRITSEACVHHLWFSDKDYIEKGTHIKWNPAVKTEADRAGIWKALLDNRIDVLATDHAPHTIEEKNNGYFQAPSGGPLVQHALQALLAKADEGLISKERIIEKACHAPARCLNVIDRGYIREGYFADLVLVNPNDNKLVSKDNLYYHCGWSPFEGVEFKHQVEQTLVNGKVVYNKGSFAEPGNGMRLSYKSRS